MQAAFPISIVSQLFFLFFHENHYWLTGQNKRMRPWRSEEHDKNRKYQRTKTRGKDHGRVSSHDLLQSSLVHPAPGGHTWSFSPGITPWCFTSLVYNPVLWGLYIKKKKLQILSLENFTCSLDPKCSFLRLALKRRLFLGLNLRPKHLTRWPRRQSTLKLSKSPLLSRTNSEKQNPPERELYRQE